MQTNKINKFKATVPYSHGLDNMSGLNGNRQRIPRMIRSVLTHLKSFLVAGPTLKSLVMFCCFILGFAHQGFGQESTLSGVWIHSRDSKEQTQRFKAIDRVTKTMPQLFRERARQMLRERTTPLSNIRLTDSGDLVTIITENRRITLTTDGSPTQVRSENGTAVVHAKREDGKLIVTSQAQDGLQRTVYRVSENGARLVLDISISGDRLNEKVQYQVSYDRESKN